MDKVWIVTKRDYNETNVILVFDGSLFDAEVQAKITEKYPRVEWDYSDFTNGKIGKHSEIDFYLMSVEKGNNNG